MHDAWLKAALYSACDQCQACSFSAERGHRQQATHLWVMWAGRRGATVSSRPVMVASSLLTQPM